MPNRLTMSTTTTNCRWEQENVVQRGSYQDGANVVQDLLIRLQKLESENTIVKDKYKNLHRQKANANDAKQHYYISANASPISEINSPSALHVSIVFDSEHFAEATEISTVSDERASVIRCLQKELQDEREEVERLGAKIGRHKKDLNRTIPFQWFDLTVPEMMHHHREHKLRTKAIFYCKEIEVYGSS